MPIPVLVWVFGLTVIVFASFMVVLYRQWRTGRLVIDERQLWLREFTLLTLVVVVLMLGWMVISLDRLSDAKAAGASAQYLATQAQQLAIAVGGTGLATLMLAVLAVADWRLVALNRLRAEARLAADTAKQLRHEPHDD